MSTTRSITGPCVLSSLAAKSSIGPQQIPPAMVSPFPYELTILLQTPKHLYKITFMVSHVPSVYKTILWFFTYASYSFSVNINSVQKFLSPIIMSIRGSYTLLAVQNTKKIVQFELICQRGFIYSSPWTINQIAGSVRITCQIAGS